MDVFGALKKDLITFTNQKELMEKQSNKAFIGVNHGTGKIDLTHLGSTIEFKPIEIHLKEDGAKDDTPVVAIVMYSPYFNCVAGQISLKMFNEGLADIGYEIVKK